MSDALTDLAVELAKKAASEVAKKVGETAQALMPKACAYCHQCKIGNYGLHTPCCRKGLCWDCPPEWAHAAKSRAGRCPLCSKVVAMSYLDTLAK